MPEPFDRLACDIARYQAAYVEGYARLCAARAAAPSSFRMALDCPAVPTDAFKVCRVAAFPKEETTRCFRTSGTTLGSRGSHELRDLGSYDAAAVAFGRWSLAHDLSPRAHLVALAPSPQQAPDSSLSHMIDLFVRTFGVKRADAETYFIQGDTLDVAGLDQRIARALVAHEPVLLLATSFALVFLLEALDEAPFRLPNGSRVMMTGGFKGRSREIDEAELRRTLAHTFAVPPRDIAGEYGMTELSSQFYEGTIRDAGARSGVYVEPPWARVVPVDPETLAPVAAGEIGMARIEDLMNVDSAFAVLASDRVKRVEGGFVLVGRATGATPRGCSIAVDEMLGNETGAS